MKKLIYLLVTVILCFSLTACGSSSKPAYTEELPYLPAYSSTMELQEFVPNINQTDYSQGIYTIKNTTNEEILDEYEKILLADGWTIYEDNRPNTVALSKDEHRVLLLPQQGPDYVNLYIIAK